MYMHKYPYIITYIVCSICGANNRTTALERSPLQTGCYSLR